MVQNINSTGHRFASASRRGTTTDKMKNWLFTGEYKASPPPKNKFLEFIGLGSKPSVLKAGSGIASLAFITLMISKFMSSITGTINSYSLVQPAQDNGDFIGAARARQAYSADMSRSMAWGTSLLATATSFVYFRSPIITALTALLGYSATKSLLPPHEKFIAHYGNGKQHSPNSELTRQNPHPPDDENPLKNNSPMPPEQQSPYGNNPLAGGRPQDLNPDNNQGDNADDLGSAGIGDNGDGNNNGAGNNSQPPNIINISVQGGHGGTVHDVAVAK